MFGIFASIGSAIVSTVSTAISTIGPAISSFCANVLPRIAPVIERGLEAINAVVQVAQAVMQVFGIFKADEQLEDIGDRSIQAAEKGITVDQFDDFDQYMETLRNFDLDPQRTSEISTEAKTVAGLAIGSKGLDEKFEVNAGTMANLWVLVASNPEYFNADRLQSILNKTADIATVLDYFDNKLTPTEALATEKTLVEAEKAFAADKDDKTIYAELDAASAAVQNL